MSIVPEKPEVQSAKKDDHSPGVVPHLAEGVELVGQYEGSGFKEASYLVQRADGQMVKLARPLYLIALQIDGRRDFAQIAEKVSQELSREVSADNIRFLVEEKLRPLGVLAAADGSSPKTKRIDPFLALKHRVTLVPEGAVGVIAKTFWPFFLPPVIAVVLAGLLVFDAWFFFIHGVAQSMREVVYQPELFLLVLGLSVLSVVFHEFGHATASRYGGAKPGAIGAGIYIIWPALYTDVTGTYRLGRVGRLRTDFGGIYFNVIFSLAVAGVYFLTSFEVLLVVILLQHLDVFRQFMPFLRLDGYYIVSDLTGVPDLFGYIKPILKSLLPNKETSASVKELKPRVRIVVTAWVLSVIPILLFLFTMMVISAPRVFATTWDSMLVHFDETSVAFANHEILASSAGMVQMALLLLPLAGITLLFWRLMKLLGSGAWRWTEGSPAGRAGIASTLALAAGIALFVLWPNGDYEPIQPGESGTITDGAVALTKVYTGRPAYTAEYERELLLLLDADLKEQNEHAPAAADSRATEPSSEPSSDASSPPPTANEPASDESAAPEAAPTASEEEPADGTDAGSSDAAASTAEEESAVPSNSTSPPSSSEQTTPTVESEKVETMPGRASSSAPSAPDPVAQEGEQSAPSTEDGRMESTTPAPVQRAQPQQTKPTPSSGRSTTPPTTITSPYPSEP